MAAQRYIVALEQSEVQELKVIIGKGVSKARTITRARVLLMANENGSGKTDKAISRTLGIDEKTPKNIRKRYARGGLNRALFDAPRPGKARKVTGRDEAEIVSIACTDPPDGHDHWTMDLLTEEVTETLRKTLGRSTVYRVILRNDLKPWREKNLVY
jgi:transposase